MRVLHLTTHLGGGVGRALAGLVASSRLEGSFQHDIVCVDTLEKDLFANAIRDMGGRVDVCPPVQVLHQAMATADIVHVEFWNHPAILGTLAAVPDDLPMRLVVWCHVSGLGTPTVPRALVLAAHRFVATSPCTLDASSIRSLPKEARLRVSAIPSAGGFSGPRVQRPIRQGPLRMGYIGSLQLSKMHLDWVRLVAALDPQVPVRIFGDPIRRAQMEEEARHLGHPHLLQFEGFVSHIQTIHGELDVMPYLLNPHHYGTNENALLEAMAAGIVPIVWNNPAEVAIVRHGHTGFVVEDRASMLSAWRALDRDRDLLARLSEAAATDVRTRFDPAETCRLFSVLYEEVMREPARRVSFQKIFGSTPAEWFLSCHGEPQRFREDGTVVLPEDPASRANYQERTKGSVLQFHEHCPGDGRLAQWATSVRGQA